jgi:copper chaperone NosL
MKRPHLFAMALLLSLLPSACGAQPPGPQPPEIVYGQDLCDGCGMIISEARFAAATLLTDGAGRRFDEIGDMLAYHMEHPEAQVKAWFVHDHLSEAWVRGETAWYVEADRLQTPMGGRIVAFEDKGAAEAYAAQVNGNVYTLDALRVDVHLRVHGN